MAPYRAIPRYYRCDTPPKGPFRTKNTTTIAKTVNFYAEVFLLRPPNLVRHGPFLERKNVCNSQENGARTRHTAIVNHPAVLKIQRVVDLLRVVFLVRRGPLGILRDTFERRLALPPNGASPPHCTWFHTGTVTGTSLRYPILQRIAR